MRRRSKKYLCFIAFLLFITSYISSSFIFAYFRDVYLPELLHFVTDLLPDDIKCYNDNINSTINESFYVPNSIFFYQTNCESTISLRRACSIEAAWRSHRHRRVYVLFANQPNLNHPVIQEILKLKNIYISKVNVMKFGDNTPFRGFFQQIILEENDRYKITTDYLKLVSLYNNGGVVLDLDLILAKSVDDLGDNWILMDDSGFSVDAMKLAYDIIGQAIAGMILRNLKKQVEVGVFNAAIAIEDSLEELCSISTVKNVTYNNCSGVKIHDSKIFNPISYSNRYQYFKSGKMVASVYGYHTWDNGVRKSFPGHSLYSKLARTYCPRIFSTFMYDFITDY